MKKKKELKFTKKQKILIILISAMLTCLLSYSGSVYSFNKTQAKYDNTSGIIKASHSSYVCEVGYNEIVELLVDNPWAHNSIFRGEDVTKYYTDGSLYDRIKGENGYNLFEDLYVGDYIKLDNVKSSDNEVIIWRIAGFDIYLGKGDSTDTSVNQTYNRHHAVIVPDSTLTTAQKNSSNTTTGGYVGSQMYTTTLPSVLTTYIEPVFGNHILQYRNLLTNATTSKRITRFGSSSDVSSSWEWYTRSLDLMNENQVFGSIAWSSSGYETGSDNIQFPLFRLKPEFVIGKPRSAYWLRTVVNGGGGPYVAANGRINTQYVTSSFGVRPYFYIG